MPDKVTIELKNLNEIKKTLSGMGDKYVSEFFAEAKNIAKPIQQAIQKAIPPSAPVRGLRARSERGRLAWGVGKRARSVVIKTNRTVKRKSAFAKGKVGEYGLVTIIAQSPAVVLSDMAGKTNKYTNKREKSAKHQIDLFGRGKIVERRYRINGQGKALIAKLSSRFGGASRMFWPAADKAFPAALREMDKLVSKLHARANKQMGSK